MQIKIHYNMPRDKYEVKLIELPATSIHIGAYKSVRGTMKVVDRLRAEGHTVDPKELNKLPMEDF